VAPPRLFLLFGHYTRPDGMPCDVTTVYRGATFPSNQQALRCLDGIIQYKDRQPMSLHLTGVTPLASEDDVTAWFADAPMTRVLPDDARQMERIDVLAAEVIDPDKKNKR
jgi:hypothetical protein